MKLEYIGSKIFLTPMFQMVFELDGFSKEKVEAKDTYTKLSLIINKPHTFGRAHTFLRLVVISMR